MLLSTSRYILMTNDEKKTEVAPAAAKEQEDRVDPFAIGMFKAMGYDGRLPNSLVTIYNAFKVKKDKLQPGRLSPEGFATVALIAELRDGKIEFGEKE